MKVDYLIVGAGATGMAFLDVILSETDATVAIVDRRDAPGGHWNDAYPFVRLHQSSCFYGVSSRDLGKNRVSETGYNAGMFELATKYEILHYYQNLMETEYLPSGRVHYFPMSEYLGDGKIRSLLSGEETDVEIGGKLVNAGIWGDITTIPLTHERNFRVDDDVTCIPPNDLPNTAPSFEQFTVIGAGKTAMDSVLWLLERGVDPDNISWVRSSEYWLFQRDNLLPHKEFFFGTMATTEKELESLATSNSVDEHCKNMESCGKWHRIDPDIWPTKFHAAVCSNAEITALRKIKNVIRAGRVLRIEKQRLVMEEGEIPTTGNALYVDCTASGGVALGADAPRVFDGDTINLLMVRMHQPLFSAALIAHMEACVQDEDFKQNSTKLTDFHDTPAQFLTNQLNAFLNQEAWNGNPEIKDWINKCRLNAAHHLLEGMTADDTNKIEVLGRLRPLTARAIANMPKFLGIEPA
jgi:hypothetical protein